jgi:pyruvate dehydrogenase E1 component beta subunit
MVAALNAALRHCLAEDPRTLVLGEDVGRLGGVFRVTDGLQREFGDSRVFDTPLAESGIAGVSIGLALAGWRPVAEMQFDGFSYPALDQIFTHLARYATRSRGRVTLPVVIRLPAGGGIGGPEHHSESPEAHFAHVAGLKVVYPATPLDAYNLLVRSIRDPDPVIFLEPKGRYWVSESGASTSEGPPIGVARVLREGADCSLIAYGAMVARCLAAAEAAAEDGVELEVVDMRSLVPLDMETLATSVRKTGRAVVVHEAPLTAGFGAEVASRLMEDCFRDLHAPIGRVTGYDIPYPPARLEQYQLPSVDRILLAVQRVLDS